MGVTSNPDNHCEKMIAALRLHTWWEPGQLDMLILVNFDSLVGGECVYIMLEIWAHASREVLVSCHLRVCCRPS